MKFKNIIFVITLLGLNASLQAQEFISTLNIADNVLQDLAPDVRTLTDQEPGKAEFSYFLTPIVINADGTGIHGATFDIESEARGIGMAIKYLDRDNGDSILLRLAKKVEIGKVKYLFNLEREDKSSISKRHQVSMRMSKKFGRNEDINLSLFLAYRDIDFDSDADIDDIVPIASIARSFSIFNKNLDVAINHAFETDFGEAASSLSAQLGGLYLEMDDNDTFIFGYRIGL